MEGRLLGALGKIAGLAGISLGVVFLLFRQVLQQHFAPLGPAHAYAVIMSLMTFTFGIAVIGIFAWLLSMRIRPSTPLPWWALSILAAIVIVVLGATYGVGLQPAPQADIPLTPPTVRVVTPINICVGNGGGTSCLGPGVVAYTCDEYNKIGGGADATYVAFNQRFCGGRPEATKKNVRHNYSRDGGQCGWTSFTVTCIE